MVFSIKFTVCEVSKLEIEQRFILFFAPLTPFTEQRGDSSEIYFFILKWGQKTRSRHQNEPVSIILSGFSVCQNIIRSDCRFHFSRFNLCVFWHPLLRFLTQKWASIVEAHAYITLGALLVIEWRHELIANDWRSIARNLTVVCSSVMFTIQWLMLQHWHASPQGDKSRL